MIISENIEKVKRKALNLVNKSSAVVSKPEKKFMLEMVLGMVLGGSSSISEIGRHLHEPIALKHTTKRLERMLCHSHLLKVCNQLCLEEVVDKIDGQTVLALDGGDTVHPYGKDFDHLNVVHDGSRSELQKGYWLNQISGYNPNTHETFPVALDIYSSSEPGYKSANDETLNLVGSTLDLIGIHGLWVMDRAYDSGVILDYFLKRGLNFVVRMDSGKSGRNVLYKGRKKKINEVAGGINRRVTFDKYRRFGSVKIELRPKYRKYQLTLICLKDKRNKEPMLLLTNGWIKSTRELKRRIRGYFHRWGVEECYRFEKQGFGIEKATVRRFSRIRTLTGLTLLSWLLLVKINESTKLRAVVLKLAKMEKNKPKQQPKFIYYRLLKGVQRIFRGIKELFRFRWKKRVKQCIMKEVEKQRLLFPQLHQSLKWTEISR